MKIKKIEFLKGIFGHISYDAIEQPLFCSFDSDPRTNKRWRARTMQQGRLPSAINKNNNNYFQLATFSPNSAGRYRAKSEYFDTGFAFLIDDLGTKVNRSDFKLDLSWMVETSPGNYQGGLLLDKPCKDKKLFADVIKALGKKKLSDPGASGVARWARMPFGINSKSEHLNDGAAPIVKLVEWHPERKYSIKQIIEALGLNIKAKADRDHNGSNRSHDESGDTVLSALKAAGLWKNNLQSGQHDVICPWTNLHTDKIDHGASYFEPSTENKQAGGFNCHHGHCKDRNINDLKEYLGLSGFSQRKYVLDEIISEIVKKITVFHNENGESFAFIDGHCRQLKSREAKADISRMLKSMTGKIVRQSNLTEVLAALESESLLEGKEQKLFNRVASYNNFIWYDLGNGKAIKVGHKAWKIVKAPILFRRYGHQQKQVTPSKEGDPWQLFKLLNIPKAHQLETLVLLITYLVPDIAHPIFHPHGAQGSGKTTGCKMVKQLIDPSSLEAIFAPKDKSELIRQINRHYLSIFDNMSKLDSEMSDILCLSCTGGGIAKRVLYSDDDDCIYNFKRCIGLNGINLLITKPDLLDRTMLLHLERISPKKRKEDTEIWRDFEQAKPKILGGMFNVLAKARAKHPKVKLEKLPRMADFAKWGYAVAEALGKDLGNQFLLDYESNIKRQNAEVLQNNSLCLAVKLLMKSEGHWEGTVKGAYEALYQIINPSKGDNTFPADAKNMRKHLERIQTTLAESEHITYSFSDKPKRDGYHIVFKKIK